MCTLTGIAPRDLGITRHGAGAHGDRSHLIQHAEMFAVWKMLPVQKDACLISWRIQHLCLVMPSILGYRRRFGRLHFSWKFWSWAAGRGGLEGCMAKLTEWMSWFEYLLKIPNILVVRTHEENTGICRYFYDHMIYFVPSNRCVEKRLFG